jgi:hypothetical protein
VTATALGLAGIAPELTVGAAVAVFLVGAYLTPLLARFRSGAKPVRESRDQPFRTLFDQAERHRFEQVLDAARQITDTWPDLAGLIDRRDAVWALNQALWDLADLLSAHQEVRRIAESLEAQNAQDPPLSDGVSHDLAAQMRARRGTDSKT